MRRKFKKINLHEKKIFVKQKEFEMQKQDYENQIQTLKNERKQKTDQQSLKIINTSTSSVEVRPERMYQSEQRSQEAPKKYKGLQSVKHVQKQTLDKIKQLKKQYQWE